MPVSRRGFLRIVGANERSAMGALLAARGHEEFQAQAQAQQTQTQTGRGAGAGRGGGGGQGGRGGAQGAGRAERPAPPPGIEEIRISSNENPLGPGKTVLDAILGEFPEAGRYPFNSTPNEGKLVETVASVNKAKPENVVMGGGSQEILRTAVRAFTSPFRPLVTGAPTFENCTGFCRRLGHPVHEVKVDSQFRINLEEMLTVVRGAGLVFLNNPNNPTATVHSAKTVQNFVERVRRISPDTVILIDEAYHDYVTDPNYSTAIPLALSTPNVFVARTFSKAYGMAGMRIGYAIGDADTIKPMARLKMPYNISVFGIAAAIAALNDPKHIEQERARNTQVRAFTVKALEELGGKATASEGNFIFVDIGRPAREFRDACANQWVAVGRDFPPFEHSHVRISIGTMAEMQRATTVFREVLRPVVPSGGGGR
ncbi:MAG TPA: histidinol-phosphate transaminase [Vicinamibacterales bacterium]|nr:histidinol-phosphate transaminase [Vicinamibacterales bacterium]